jgi:hypothetical protein
VSNFFAGGNINKNPKIKYDINSILISNNIESKKPFIIDNKRSFIQDFVA